jgi:hypothetical protein
MNYKVIKVDEDNYNWLLRESLSLQAVYNKKISMNETLTHLKRKQTEKILSFAGSWIMTEKEADKFITSSKSGWRKWKSA